MSRARWLVLLVALLGCPAGPDAAAPPEKAVAVAAAADLRFALDEVVAAISSRGARVNVTYGASGSLFAQVSNGAPYDAFLSADRGYARAVVEGGRAQGPEFLYAIGHVVLWSAHGSGIDVAALGTAALVAPGATKVAIANPKTAPYGRAAEAALRSLGLYDAVAPRLVLGDNVAQTAQFIESGAAQVGFISRSLAVALGDKGTSWEVPAGAHPRLEQAGVLLRTEATAFRDFLLGPEGRAILVRHGFEVP